MTRTMIATAAIAILSLSALSGLALTDEEMASQGVKEAILNMESNNIPTDTVKDMTMDQIMEINALLNSGNPASIEQARGLVQMD
jgi:hypothetical protein